MTSNKNKDTSNQSADFLGFEADDLNDLASLLKERSTKKASSKERKAKSRGSSSAKKKKAPSELSQLLELAEDRGYVLVKEIKKAAPNRSENQKDLKKLINKLRMLLILTLNMEKLIILLALFCKN